MIPYHCKLRSSGIVEFYNIYYFFSTHSFASIFQSNKLNSYILAFFLYFTLTRTSIQHQRIEFEFELCKLHLRLAANN